LSSGKVEVNWTYVQPKKLIEETLAEIEVLKKDLQIIQYTHIGNNDWVEIDEKIFKNIVINFTSNAIKYSKDNGLIKVISVLENAQLKVSVIDNGIGIPITEQNNVFERFFRAHNVTNIQGTGLGLNIVKKYVELLGGTIDFKSIPDKETEFTILIPVILSPTKKVTNEIAK
jgi:signal transduction histidine kinase